MTAKTKLKKNKSPNDRVLEVLRKKRKPLSAYDILGVLNKDGITAPPTVYRALTKLVSDGCVHRIETLNAYVACSEDDHHHHGHHSDNNFAVCRSCGDVAEIHDHKIEKIIKDWSEASGFNIERNMLEIIGTCSTCSGAKN